MIISICGKSASGKSTLAKYLKEIYGESIVHIDIDKIGHNVLTYEKVKKDLVNTFGNNVITNNSVDRKALGKIVFNSLNEMDKLTIITWKYMEIEIDKILNENSIKIIILDWLLLPKTKYFNISNVRLLLDIPYEIRKERAMNRDNISSEAFDLRDKATIDYSDYYFDYILKENNYEIIRKVIK